MINSITGTGIKRKRGMTFGMKVNCILCCMCNWAQQNILGVWTKAIKALIRLRVDCVILTWYLEVQLLTLQFNESFLQVPVYNLCKMQQWTTFCTVVEFAIVYRDCMLWLCSVVKNLIFPAKCCVLNFTGQITQRCANNLCAKISFQDFIYSFHPLLALRMGSHSVATWFCAQCQTPSADEANYIRGVCPSVRPSLRWSLTPSALRCENVTSRQNAWNGHFRLYCMKWLHSVVVLKVSWFRPLIYSDAARAVDCSVLPASRYTSVPPSETFCTSHGTDSARTASLGLLSLPARPISHDKKY